MAGSLESVLARIPGIAGYHAKKQLNEREDAQAQASQMGQLQQMGALQGILAKVQAQKQAQQEQQEMGQMKTVVQQAGGNPAKAIESLLATGNPRAIELAAKLKGLMPKQPEERVVAPGGTVLGADGAIKFQAPFAPDKPQPVSSLGKLISERDALPDGHPQRAVYDQAIKSASKGSATNVTVNTGAMNLGKAAQTKVDEGLLDTTQGMMRLSTIEGQFKPQFQQTMPRVNAEWSSWKDKLGVGMQPQDRQFLTEFSAYKRNAINSMNEYIKSITGAAMSEAEAQRILRGMPNPGQGMFDGDSPTEFKAKLDDAMKQTKLSLARYEYIKRRGISLSDPQGNSVIPLEKMPQLMNDRGRELEEGFKKANPNIQADALSKMVRGMLAKEFGLIR